MCPGGKGNDHDGAVSAGIQIVPAIDFSNNNHTVSSCVKFLYNMLNSVDRSFGV